MGMYLSSNIGISFGQFRKLCHDMGLPGPIVNDSEYVARIDRHRYEVYENRARLLFERLYEHKSTVNVTEFEFLNAWRIIYSARIDWLVENDPEQEEPWEDIYFA